MARGSTPSRPASCTLLLIFLLIYTTNKLGGSKNEINRHYSFKSNTRLARLFTCVDRNDTLRCVLVCIRPRIPRFYFGNLLLRTNDYAIYDYSWLVKHFVDVL